MIRLTKRVLFGLSVVLFPLTAVAIPPATVLDQLQSQIDGTVGGAAVGGASNQRLAQTVTVGFDGRLGGVHLPIACTDGTLEIEVRDVTATGLPGSVVLDAHSFPAAHLPNIGIVFRFLRLGNIPLLAGDRIAFVLDNPTGVCGIFQGPVGNTYSDGSGFFEALPNPPGFLLLGEREDLPFITQMKVP